MSKHAVIKTSGFIKIVLIDVMCFVVTEYIMKQECFNIEYHLWESFLSETSSSLSSELSTMHFESSYIYILLSLSQCEETTECTGCGIRVQMTIL
jgi:hypothetical protein